MDRKPNIVFIAVDTLRADHLGCYGYRHPTSPRIDRLASEGTLCEQLFCPGIPTHPSFTTLYTGQHPVRHGIVSHGGKAQLPRATPVLPELLLQAGYTTCAVDNLWRARSWFGRGYEYYVDPSVRRGLLLAVTCEEISGRAISWLRTQGEEPFFLFLHYWDPHYPLDPPARYRNLFYEGGDPFDRGNHSLDEWWQHPLGMMARDTWLRRPEGLVTDARYVSAMYDQEIRYLDDGVANLLDCLDERGLSENTLVVLLADHGTSLTEQGIFFEHHGLYDCTIHVPLIWRWPGRIPRGARVGGMLHMNDVAPTLLQAVGIEAPEEMEGVSAWDLVRGETREGGHRQVVSLECTWQAKWSLRNDQHKLIVARDAGLRSAAMASERAADTTGAADDAVLRAMVDAYRQAFEARDLAGCLGFFADDAVVRFLIGSYQGRQAIEDWHRDRFKADVQILRVEGISVDPPRVSVHAVVSSRRLKQFLIGEVKGTLTFRVEEGLFKEAVLTPRKGVPSHLDWQFQ